MRLALPARTLSAVAAVGLVGVLTGPVTASTTPRTTTAFQCAEGFQTACAVVFGPLCRKQFCA